MFKVGDRVRFLNEKGEGVITRIEANHTAHVELEDGFSFPFPVSQLVAIHDPTKEKEKKAVAKMETGIHKLNEKNPTKNEGVFLAFLPSEPKNFLFSSIDVYLLNTLEISILYAISNLSEGLYYLVQNGTIAPGNIKKVGSFDKKFANDWNTVKLDFIFFKENGTPAIPPQQRIIKANALKIIKESSYVNNELLDSKAIIHTALLSKELELPVFTEEHIFSAQNSLELFQKKEQKQDIIKLSKPHYQAEFMEKEVDLHIEELIDSIQGMSNGSIIQVQLRHFQKELEDAISRNMKKIVFIHGVGNGKLKDEIRKILKTYPRISFHDASFQKYGAGATEVTIR